jgi:uncharacterized DUF497 family protein
MEFEFDPSKSQSNQEKHGIDFVAAQAIWEDPALLEIAARTLDEPRWLVIGRIQRKHWSAVILAARHNSETRCDRTGLS